VPGDYVMLAVSDTGTGMSPATVAKAFEPFFTTKEVGDGSGLGLSMVYGFVKQSGGHVKIYSEPGAGTTIKIYLPRLLTATALVEPAAAVALPTGVGDETILVVEDDADVRDYTAGVLRELGYRIVEAGDAAEALRRLAGERRIDLLFTDVGLPGGVTGRRLAEAARAQRPGLKVLFTTGYARNAIVHNGMLDPGVELIVKPFTQRDVAQKIRAVLDAPE
jgi:CheY-like chemotaxis protein